MMGLSDDFGAIQLAKIFLILEYRRGCLAGGRAVPRSFDSAGGPVR